MREESENHALHPTAAKQNSGRWNRYGVFNTMYLLFVAWLCLKTIGCVAMFTGPWGPQVGGQLPNGHTVWYRSRPVGRETEDQLVWIDQTGMRQELWVQQYHAGPADVSVRFRDNGDKVRVVAGSRTLCSLNLRTGDFREELAEQHEWSLSDDGTILDEGRVYNLLLLIGPW